MTTLLKRPTTTRKVPAKALCFAAGVVVDQAAALDAATTPTRVEADGMAIETAPAPPPPVPVTIRARTSGLAFQGYWGQCVHDMAGYIPPAGPIAINYNHDRCQLIGSIPTPPAVVDGELVATGLLIPFTADDVCSEVIYKGAKGVPYQASVQLDLETLIVEEIEANLTVDVNGQTFTGPLVVFRQWGIEAVSVTPFGADGDTSLEFARGGEFSIRCFSAEGQPTMADTTTTTDDTTKQPAEGDFAAWAQKTFGMDVAAMNEDQKTKFQAAFAAANTAAEEPPADKSKETPTGGDTTDESKTDLGRGEAHRMMTDFGASGAVWFAEGKTYDEANKLFRKQQDDRIKALETEKAELANKANFNRGHKTPAKVELPTDPNAKPAPNMADFSGHSEARKKFMSSIKMPGPQQS